MGSSNSQSNKKVEYGDDIKTSANRLINETESFLKNKSLDIRPGHLIIRNSIENDLSSLRKIINKGGEIKIGVIGRSYYQEKFINILYLSQARHNYYQNTFISSSKLKDRTILNDNNLDSEFQESIENILKHNFGTKVKTTNCDIKLANYYPTPEIINDNLMVTCSSKLNSLCEISNNGNNLSSNEICNVEIDIDDVTKFLLFSAMHDLMIYIPENGNLLNEISYLDFIANNTLILKLLRRNNFYVILDKGQSQGEMTKRKLQDLIIKLGSTVINELDYSNAENDKIKFLGSMICKHGESYAKGATFEEVQFINTKFDQVLYSDEYTEYLDKKKAEEEKEKKKKINYPNYEEAEIKTISFKKFKDEYVYKMNEIFVTTSGVDKIEENLFASFLKIIDDKINLIRSNITFKTLLYENFAEIGSNDFSNLVIITRNEIVDEMNSSFLNYKNVLKYEELNLINSCENLMSKIITIKKNATSKMESNMNIENSFTSLFNINGDFVPYNSLVKESRREYFAFNKQVFTALTKLSNVCFKIFEMLSRTITNKYNNIFIELEKKHNQKQIEKMMNNRNSNSSENSSFNNINNFPLEQIIKSKLDKINMLSINLISIFAFSNFSLNEIFPWYIIPSYGGSSIFTLSLIASTYTKTPFKVFTAGGVIFAVSLLISYFLKKKFIKDSKLNFENNIEQQLISFLSVKKDKIINFQKVFDKFTEIYSRETLELIDLISGLK